jgi:hypothetical protein
MTVMQLAAPRAALIAVCTAALAATVHAQQAQPAPAKPPAQRNAASAPAAQGTAAGASAPRGFGTARGPILTRDELRTCLAQEDDYKKRVVSRDTARAPLEQEKKAIADDQIAMRTERAKLDAGATDPAVVALNERSKAFTERLERWNARVKAFTDAGRTGSAAEREREAINAERVELENERAAIETERVRINSSRAEVVNAFNAKVAALDARVADWNKRNNAWNDSAAAMDAERTTWMSNCGNRRYREDDEIAIRQGK